MNGSVDTHTHTHTAGTVYVPPANVPLPRPHYPAGAGHTPFYPPQAVGGLPPFHPGGPQYLQAGMPPPFNPQAGRPAKFCHICGKQQHADAKFCTSCGTALPA